MFEAWLLGEAVPVISGYIYITIVTDDFQLYEGCYDSHIPATQSTPPKGPHPSLAHSHVEARHML